MKSFGKFFDSEELSRILDRKVDIDQLNKVSLEKTSVAQMNQLKMWLETFNDRLKHLSVIQGQIVDNMQPTLANDREIKLEQLASN